MLELPVCCLRVHLSDNRAFISVSCMSLKENSFVGIWKATASNFCSLFLLFCCWPPFQLCGGIPEGEPWNMHISVHEIAYTCPNGLTTLCIILGLIFRNSIFSGLHVSLDCVSEWKSELAIHRWRMLQDLTGLASELGLPHRVGANVDQE